jgi:hypothetical protein
MLAIGCAGCATKKFVRTNVDEVNDKVIRSSRPSNRHRNARARTKAGSAKSLKRRRRLKQPAERADQSAQRAGQTATQASTVATPLLTRPRRWTNPPGGW